MVGELIYAFRVMRLPLLDTGGAPIGKIDDIVVVSGRATEARMAAGLAEVGQHERVGHGEPPVGNVHLFVVERCYNCFHRCYNCRFLFSSGYKPCRMFKSCERCNHGYGESITCCTVNGRSSARVENRLPS